MKVILNVDAITTPLTGIGRYALELARGLAAHPEIDALKLFSAYRWVDRPDGALAANRAIATLRRHLPFKTLALETYTQLRAALFRQRTRKLHDHVFHSPNYVLMPFDGIGVVTVHDLSFLHYPEHHPPERIRFLERHLPETLRRARAVIGDSEFVRKELVSRLGTPPERTHTVPLGVDARFRPAAAETVNPILSQWKLSWREYLIVVATLEPRKNLVRLLRAYAALPAATRERLPLVLVGASGWLTTELERVLPPLERTGQVRRLGYVSEDQLPALYAGALGCAFPSLYEGFGLPALEAMASGVPVLTSDSGSLPEVCGDAALLVEPLDEDAIRAGLQRMIEDTQWREQAIARGRERALGYTWSNTVEATMQVYRIARDEPAYAQR